MLMHTIDVLLYQDDDDIQSSQMRAYSPLSHSQIDIAVPITQSWPLALTSEAKFEVRTPRAFKVRFTKVGVDTYVQVRGGLCF